MQQVLVLLQLKNDTTRQGAMCCRNPGEVHMLISIIT